MRSNFFAISVVASATLLCGFSDAKADEGQQQQQQPLPPIPADAPRGALRKDIPIYEAARIAKVFTCFDGSRSMPYDRVNDEYCDCADGSDEPGTAACSLEAVNNKEWRFRCADSGSAFKDRTFRHSSVNDGICDCCDGSDEYAGHMACPNTCAELAAEEEKKAAEREERRRLGLAAKKEMEAAALENIEEAKKKMEAAEAKMKEMQRRMDEMKERKETAEAEEKAERETYAAQHADAVRQWEEEQKKRLSSAEFQKPHWGCVRWAQTGGCKGDGPLEEINKTCAESIAGTASGFCVCRKRTDEYLAKIRAGEANLKADEERRAEELDKATHDEKEREAKEKENTNNNNENNGEPVITEESAVVEDDEMPEDDNINKNKYPSEYNQQQVDRLVGVVGEDTLLRYDCGHELFTCEEMCDVGGDMKVRAAHKETYGGATHDGSGHETEAGRTVRAEYNSLSEEYSKAEREHTEAKKKLEELSREDVTLAFRSMIGLCYERQFHNYKYSFCPFIRASQDSTSLGTWKGFGEQTYSSWGAKHDFSVMKFEGGQQCWGGPQRSLTVRVLCGEKNEILSVEEPSMCSYHIKFVSPAICE